MDLAALLTDPETWIIFGVFAFAGFAKGIVGLGLPIVSLGLLTPVVGLPSAMALLLVPSFSTNVWQSVAGPGTSALLKRMATMIVAFIVCTWIGVALLVRIDAMWMSILLGMSILGYGGLGLLSPKVPQVGDREAWMGPLAGGLNGVITGMTGSSVVPGVFYLQGLGLDRNLFVKAIGIHFTVGAIALGAALWYHGRLGATLGIQSVLACVPAFLGMAIGARVRYGLSDEMFRRVFFASLILLGIYVIFRAVNG